MEQKYTVKKLSVEDAQEILPLYLGNIKFANYTNETFTLQNAIDDLQSLPEGKTANDKVFFGYYAEKTLVAIADIILRYPNDCTAFIGLFMIEASLQGQGIGRKLYEWTERWIANQHFTHIRLGVIAENVEGKSFWSKMGFVPTGVVTKWNDLKILVFEKKIFF